MKTILVINDHTPQAEHAAKAALRIAQHARTDLLIGSYYSYAEKMIERLVAGPVYKDTCHDHEENNLCDQLEWLNEALRGFKPKINAVDLSGGDEAMIAGYALRNNVDMIIVGIQADANAPKNGLSNALLLRKAHCPVLFVPYHWPIKAIERMFYIADLRYCRLDVVRSLVRLAAPLNAAVSIAHLCASSLPEMDVHYAESLFEKQIRDHVNYPPLSFTTVNERNVNRAIDVLIHGLRTDIIVLTNGGFHFHDVLGSSTIDDLPVDLSVPLLVFP